MTTSKPKSAYVWIWLPQATQPIVAGKLEANGAHHDFFYGQSYCNNANAIALSPWELPLERGQRFTSDREIHGVIYDALPDSWGRRVLFNQFQRTDLSLLEMLLLSSSDRIGGLHFQSSATDYTPHDESNMHLEQLLEAVSIIEQGQRLPKALNFALMHGTSIGGARPKALIDTDHNKYIAKFSSTTDIFPMVQAEYAAMWLAQKVGINAAHVRLVTLGKKFVLLVERFDRVMQSHTWSRKLLMSALTVLGLDETEAVYTSYLDLADIIRRDCKDPIKDLPALFRRMVFNILIGNTDDHAKNHAFFWDGRTLDLTPAYDICPYLRAGQEATQAMIVGKFGRYSSLNNALSAAPWFDLTPAQAKTEIVTLTEKVKKFWPQACDAAKLTQHQQKQLTGTAVLNPYCFYDFN